VQVAISYGIDRPAAQRIQSSIEVTRTTAAVENSTSTRPGTRTRPGTKAQHATPVATTKSPQGLFVGSGFDSCAAPSARAMTKWLASPFRSVGIYIGGANRACAQAHLTPSLLAGIVRQGWRDFPSQPRLQARWLRGPSGAR